MRYKAYRQRNPAYSANQRHDEKAHDISAEPKQEVSYNSKERN